MSLSFEEQIQHANVLLQENEWEKSIDNYQEALKLATNDQQKIHLNSVLGRLYQKMKKPQDALTAFEEALALYDNGPEAENQVERASLLNNLAAIYTQLDTAKAIENYKAALDIFTVLMDNGQTTVAPHLANTQFALAEVYNKKSDFYFAKKYYKEAIKLYERLPEDMYHSLRASAHYQLGNIYTEEFYEFDAKMQYLKALSLFEGLISEGEESFQPYLAAVLNNLGVTFNAMGEPEKALEHYDRALRVYQELSGKAYDIFQPYVAATLSSMGIVHAEMKDFEKAIAYIGQAVELYNGLADSRPQEYTHYLATGLHNLGLFHFEIKQLQPAMDYFGQALEIRRRLASEQPINFDPDFCATALNLVELYQAEMEVKVDFDYKTKALELLNDVGMRLRSYNDDRPVIKNMKNDCDHYTEYFNTVDEEALTMHLVFGKVKELNEEIDSTIVPQEKLVFQQQVMELLTEKFKLYPGNIRLRNELALAHANLGWLLLRSKRFDESALTIKNVPNLQNPPKSLQCNLAHSYLLQNQLDLALPLYEGLKDQTNDEGKTYQEIILKDFDILERDGIHHDGFEKVRQLLS